MIGFPKSVLDAARDAAAKNADDIVAATDEAERAIRALPEFAGLVDSLVRSAVQQMIYAARSAANARMRRDAGVYGAAAKVNVAGSEAVNQVYESYFNYAIAGTVLGSLKGADLPAVAESERAVVSGHEFNARLCEALAELVPEDKEVREAVSERKLRELFKRLKGKERDAA